MGMYRLRYSAGNTWGRRATCANGFGSRIRVSLKKRLRKNSSQVPRALKRIHDEGFDAALKRLLHSKPEFFATSVVAYPATKSTAKVTSKFTAPAFRPPSLAWPAPWLWASKNPDPL